MMELLEVFYSPTSAFARLRDRKWAWVVPTLLIILVTVAMMAAILNKFSVTDIILEQSRQSGNEVPEEAMGTAVSFLAIFMYASPLFSVPSMILVIALVLYGLVKGFSGETSYSHMLNAASYAFWPVTVVSSALMLVMLLAAPDIRAFNLENPIPLNAGFFLGAETVGKAAAAFLTGISLVNFYFVYLLALGASQLSQRVRLGSVLGPLLGIYALWYIGKAGLAALFG
jgi:hypothetical protein